MVAQDARRGLRLRPCRVVIRQAFEREYVLYVIDTHVRMRLGLERAFSFFSECEIQFPKD